MSVVPVADVLQGRVAVDSEVTVRGWVRTRRDSKAGFSFLAVYDGSCFDPVQAVINNSLPNYNQEVLRLTTGCSVIVTGKVVASQGQGQSFEIQATSVEVTGWVEDPDTYPMAAKRHSIEYLREVAHLRPRTNLIGAVARVRHTLAQALHRFFNEQGFFWVSTPLITASDTEGAGEMFRVSTLDLENLPRNDQGKVDFDKDFFGKESFLTVSGQLNGETYACALSKIYTFGPTFRAENSNTSRHLAEFWMLEPEVAFANLNDVAGLAEAMLKYVFKAVLEERADDMQFFAERVDKDAIDRLQRFITADFAQVDYTDAVTILENCGKQFDNPVYWGVDLSSEHERYLAEEHFKAPVVVKNYPKDIKAFYMRLTKTVKPSRQWTFWRRASARLSAVPSVKSVSTCLTRVWQRWGLTKKTTGGIATCVATAPCRIPASVWASNASSLTSPACRTSAMLFRSRGRRATRHSKFF